MNPNRSFITRIFKGAVFFLLPLVLLIFAIEKAVVIVESFIIPLKKHLPEERIFGIGMFSLISLLLLLLVCYIAGMMTDRKIIKSFIIFLEDNLLVMIPGFSLMKSRANEVIGEVSEMWPVVMAGNDSEWKIGLQVDREVNGYCMVFFPEPPDAKSGELKMLHESNLKILDMPVGKLITLIRKYGQGACALVSTG